jgi:hypothetical protein
LQRDFEISVKKGATHWKKNLEDTGRTSWKEKSKVRTILARFTQSGKKVENP